MKNKSKNTSKKAVPSDRNQPLTAEDLKQITAGDGVSWGLLGSQWG
jgi:hypothetical protein